MLAALLSFSPGVPLQNCPRLQQKSCCHTKTHHGCSNPQRLDDCPLMSSAAASPLPEPIIAVRPSRVDAGGFSLVPLFVASSAGGWHQTHQDLLLRLHVLRI